MTHDFHKFWLKITAITVAAFGPVFFLGTMDTTLEPARFTIDFIMWPIDGEQTFSNPETRLMSALTGGFLVGWGVMIWFLSGDVYDASPDAVRKAVVAAALAWFVVDGLGSTTSGNALNVVFNTGFLVVAVGPLCWPARRKAQTQSIGEQ